MNWITEELRVNIKPLFDEFGVRLLGSLEEFINSQDIQVAALSNTERYIEDSRALSCEVTLFVKTKNDAFDFNEFNVFVSKLKTLRGDRWTVRRLTSITRTVDDKTGVSVLEIVIELAYLFY